MRPRAVLYVASRVHTVLVRQRFALISFLIPLLIRLIPEIIAGPYPIGYDTITAYVPAMKDWASGNTAGQLDVAEGGWLIFVLFGVLYNVTRIDPVTILKVAAPTLYGLLGLSEYFFSRKVLGWSSSKSAILVLVASTYFVSLRISWDLLRNLLGLTLMLPTIAVWRQAKSLQRLALLSGLLLLVVAAHPLVGVLVSAIILVHAGITRGGYWRQAVATLPSATWCGVSVLGFSAQGTTILAYGNQITNPLAALSYPVYIFLPLIPVAIIGLTIVRSTLLNLWIMVCGFGILAAITPWALSTQLVQPDRWGFMMFFPLVVFSIEGFFALRRSAVLPHHLARSLGFGWILLLVILGGTYLALQAQTAFPYYSNFQPTSMLQSTIPVQYSQAMINQFAWLSSNSTGHSTIIAPNAEYGWAREYFTGNSTILGFAQGVSMQNMLQVALSQGVSRVYAVWWTIDEGWGNPGDIPHGFMIVHTDGPLGVYLFSS